MGSYKMVLIALISSLTLYIENVYKSPPLPPIPIPTPLNRDSGCPKGDGRGSEYMVLNSMYSNAHIALSKIPGSAPMTLSGLEYLC